MNKTFIGIGLVILAFALTVIVKLNGITTVNIFVIMLFGIMAWVGVYLLISEFLPNPGGPDFRFWKTIVKGFFGFCALLTVLTMGMKSANDFVSQQLEDHGVVTTAIIVDKDRVKLPAKRGQINYVHYIKLSFKDEKGKKKEVKSEVSSSKYSTVQLGGKVQITYSSKRPNILELN